MQTIPMQKEVTLLINPSEILMFYEMFDDDDISTERLLAMVADAAGCDIDDVVSVLTGDYDSDEVNVATSNQNKKKRNRNRNNKNRNKAKNA